MDNDDDFDPAAFGLPTGFGAKPKAKAAKPSYDKTKRVERFTDSELRSLYALSRPQNGNESIAKPIEPSRPSTNGEHEVSGYPAAVSGSLHKGEALDPRELDEIDHQDGTNGNGDGEEDGGTDVDVETDTDDFPVSHEVIMKDHTKAVTAISIDPPGARIVTGAYDYDVKMWDFGGMQADFRPFKTFEPYENYHVHDVAWDRTGTSFVVITGTLQAKLYDREGAQLMETVKGDMYIRDMKNTAGHVGPLTSVCWDPKNANRFLTSSYDSTLRLWDVTERFKSLKTIVVKSKDRGARTKLTKATYSEDGKVIAASGIDGTIHLWSTSSNFARPNSTIENAHTKGTETSGLTFSLDNHTLVSRGGDDTVKLWDARSFKSPVSIASNLSSLNPETNVIYSPDERFILTGTAGPKAGVVPGKEVDVRGKRGGRIVVMKKENLEVVREL
ncbi:MAG: hypothetical protein CYPHOPRED_001586, partial [Cyphobasidiales sp. Tagirdzhanova-0007]